MRLYLIWLVILGGLKALTCNAADFSLGSGIIEEGDDRLYPIIRLDGSFMQQKMQLFYYRKSQGTVTQDSLIFIASNSYKLRSWSYIYCNLGLSLLHDRTIISYFDDKAHNSRSNDNNLGFYVGLEIIKKLPWFNLLISWDSILFPAGVMGGILLANGRRQIITFAFSHNL